MKKSQLRKLIRESIKEQLANPGYVCDDGNCLDCLNPQNNSYCLYAAGTQNIPSYPTLNACLNSGCGGPDLCKQCQSGNWSGFMSWYNTWTNGAPFNSSNPNQPCTHICNKITQWQGNCAGMVGNPQWQNRIGCKIEAAQQLTHPAHHNCSC